MVVGISDGKGFTDKLSVFKREERKECAKKLFSDFFKAHLSVLKKDRWTIVKTTGDGIFFYTEKDITYCEIMKDIHQLFNSINSEALKSRLFVFKCQKEDVIHGNELGRNFNQRIKKDIYGFPLSYGFRLLSITKEAVLFTEREFMEELKNEIKADVDIYQLREFDIGKFHFSRAIPISFLKGIDECGFSYETDKKPQWIWQILK